MSALFEDFSAVSSVAAEILLGSQSANLQFCWAFSSTSSFALRLHQQAFGTMVRPESR